MNKEDCYNVDCPSRIKGFINCCVDHDNENTKDVPENNDRWTVKNCPKYTPDRRSEPEPLVAPKEEVLQPYRCLDCKYFKDEHDTFPTEYYCKKLKRFKTNAELAPPGDCPLKI